MEPVLAFLRDLKKKNNREWFQRQTERYQETKEVFTAFVEDLLQRASAFDATLQNLEASRCVFRIHRDIRFSKDKTPYKTHYGAFLSGAGKNSNGPGYYIHIEPGGKSMMAGGLYMPPTADLVAIRERIASEPKELRALLGNRALRKHFPDGMNGERSKVVRGYKPDHPAYDLLLVKNYIVWRHLSEEEVLSKALAKNVTAAFATLAPLNDWLRRYKGPEKPRDPLAD